MSDTERKMLKQEAREMFYHGYNNYRLHAFPWDELKPLSCEGRKWNERTRGDLDDCLGGFALTLIDSLDMLAILQDYEEFSSAIQTVIDNVTFDRDVQVSVFETTIRVLGGLLSAHMLASKEYGVMYAHTTRRYNNELLLLAIDLGNRLLPAFDTPTGIPYHKVNLRYGKIWNEKNETCPAAAGSLLLEMALLSRLSKNPIYEERAKYAVRAIWNSRSDADFIGSIINVNTGQWIHTHSGIGAGFDSFYEYLLKYSILFGDDEWLSMFETLYDAIESKMKFNGWHVEVDMIAGKTQIHSLRVSSLQAFWPGLQVLHGDISHAIEAHSKFYSLWKRFHSLPEIFDLSTLQVVHWARHYPLRPEFIESTYHLYQATHNDEYLQVGKNILYDLQNFTRVPCGFASIQNVHTMAKEDRMDSYFLSETLKYLYLLFHAPSEIVFPISTNNSDSKGNYLKNTSTQNITCMYCPTVYQSIVLNSPCGIGSNVHALMNTQPEEMTIEKKSIKDSQVIFSTEGHIFLVSSKLRNSVSFAQFQKSTRNQRQCENVYRTTSSKLQRLRESRRSKQPVGEFQYEMKHEKLGIVSDIQSGQGTRRKTLHEHEIAGREVETRRMWLEGLLKIKHHKRRIFRASYAKFGIDLKENMVSGVAYILKEDNGFACQALNQVRLDNYIVIVKRGMCSFVTKAWNVQSQGARGMIIFNSVPEPVARLSDNLSKKKIQVLVHDGSAHDIRIGIIMISYENGIHLTQILESNSRVEVELSIRRFFSI